jgi:uncharacterized protein YheU (UPF0270 family)
MVKEACMDSDPVEIPHGDLSTGALRGVIESFVLREGTEYGARDYTLDEKVDQVLEQLRRGEARILFDPGTETVTLVVPTRLSRE